MDSGLVTSLYAVDNYQPVLRLVLKNIVVSWCLMIASRVQVPDTSSRLSCLYIHMFRGRQEKTIRDESC